MSNKKKTNATKEEATPALVPKLRFPEFRDAEGWKETQLQKIASPVSVRAVTGDGDNVLSLSGEHGLVLQSDYFGKKVAGDRAERYLKLVRNDFVYNDRTTKASVYGTIKRLSKYDGGIVSPIYKCFRFDGGETPEFWEWYFEAGAHESQLGSLVNEGARAGRFNISISQFLSTSAWRPEEPEQQKIAECLSSVDELIAAQARQVDTLKTHKKGLMQQLFPREGETQPRLRFPEFQAAGGWGEKQLGDMCLLVRGPFGGSLKKEIFVESGYAVYEQSHAIYGDFTSFRYYIPELKYAELKRFSVKPDDIIMSCSGTMGKFAIVPQGANLGVINQALLKLSVKRGCIPVFLKEVLELPTNQEQLLSQSAGGAIKNVVSVSQIKELELFIPSLAEQQKIVDCLSCLDDLIAAQTQKLDALKTHKKGLMQQLFPSPEEVEA